MIAFAFAAASAATALPPSVPLGRAPAPPLLDGRCADAEWAQAWATDIGGGVMLLAMADARAVHLCLRLPPSSLGTFDLYLRERGGGVVNLHSSAQAGERTWTNGAWPDWTFGNHRGWYSPPVPFTGLRAADGGTRAVFGEQESREITLQSSRFDLRPGWRLMLDIRALGADREGSTTFPPGARADAPDSWAATAPLR